MTHNAQHATDRVPLWARDDRKFWAKFRPALGLSLILLSAAISLFQLHHLTGRWDWVHLQTLLMGLMLISSPQEIAVGRRARLLNLRALFLFALGLAFLATIVLRFNDFLRTTVVR
jgi:hypothetical protein